jgi:hypothetical protein
VKAGREFTREALELWQLQQFCDDAVLVVDELVSNTVRYAVVRSSWRCVATSMQCTFRSPTSRAQPQSRYPRARPALAVAGSRSSQT